MWENNNSNNNSKKIDNEIIKRNIIGIFIRYIKNRRKKNQTLSLQENSLWFLFTIGKF